MTGAHHAEPASPRYRKLTPWVAVVLSFLAPGLGHAYAGRPRLAVAIYVAVVCFGVGLIALTLTPLPALARELVLIAAVAVPLIVVPLAAYRLARRTPSAPESLGRRWYVLALVGLIAAFGVQGALVDLIKRHVAEAFKVPSGSMSPTMLIGDYIMVIPRVPDSIPRFTVVTYLADDRVFTHRIVGIPGDTLQMIDFKLFMNGVSPSEPYAHADSGAPNVAAPELDWHRDYLVPNVVSTGYRPSYGTWGPIVLPPNQYFVLGDDRANSFDSRYRGFIDVDAIVGRPVYIYLSIGDGSIRWDRLGKSIR